MLVLIHGDYLSKSRQALQSHVSQAKRAGYNDINYLDGKTCALTDVIQSTDSPSLFGESKRLTVIENLFRRRSKTELHDITAHLQQLQPDNNSIIIWEDRQLSAAQVKTIPNFSTTAYPLPKVIFKFVDSFTPNAKLPLVLNLFHQACDNDSAELVLIMLARQLRLQMQRKTRGPQFDAAQLLRLHHQLADIDVKNKTGQLSLDLKSELANWIVRVYSKYG